MRLALAAALLVLVSGCGGSDAKEPETAPSERPTASATPTDATSPTDDLNVSATKREGIYLDLVKKEDFAPLAGVPDDRLINFGQALCDLVPVDATTEQTLIALKGLLDNDFGGEDAGAMMAYASVLCPEKQAALTVGN